MTVTKLVKLSEVGRKMYTSRIDKLKANGLRVHGIIFSEYIVRSVVDTRDRQRVTLHYQNQ